MFKIFVEFFELIVCGGSVWFLEDWSNSGSSFSKINFAYDSLTRLDKFVIFVEFEFDNVWVWCMILLCIDNINWFF